MRPFNFFALPRSSESDVVVTRAEEAPLAPLVDVRRFLKGTMALGGSSVANVLASGVKAKVVAVVLGPQGVGTIGLLGTLMSTFAAVAGFALIGTGVRQVAIARSRNDDRLLVSLNRALWSMPLLLGGITATLLFVFRTDIARLALGDPRYAAVVGCLAVGVVASALAEGQLAWVSGFQRPFDVARASALGSIAAAVAGCLAVLWLRYELAIVVVVIALPLSSLAASWWYARRVKPSGAGAALAELRPLLAPLFVLGFALMLRVVIDAATQFAVRWRIQQELGLEHVGFFQAAWGISVLYLSFLYGALWIHYFPKMSETLSDRERLVSLMNEQTRIALLLGGPIIFWVYAFAPHVVSLLYTDAFVESANVLRWIVLGDLFKIPAWTIGFVLMAQNRGGLFLAKEASWNVLFFGILSLTLASHGLAFAGIAYFVSQALVLFAFWIIVRRAMTFRLSGSNRFLLSVLLGGAVALLAFRGIEASGALAYAIALVVTIYCASDLRGFMEK